MRLVHTERRWAKIPESSIAADGQENGVVTLEDTAYYKTKMIVVLQSDSYQPVRYQVQRVLSRTEMILGLTPQDFTDLKKKNPKTSRIVDISRFTVLDNATIYAPEQERPNIPQEDYERAVYEEEPVMAKRVVPVNEYGQINSPDNPLYTQLTDGNINIGTVNAEVEVQLSHKDNFPDQGDVADSVQVGDEATIAKVDPKNRSWSNNRYEKLLPLLTNAKWLDLVDYEKIIPEFSGDTATLNYYKNDIIVAKGIFRFATDYDWDFKLESYINNDNGDILLDDDGIPLFLD